MLRVVLGLVLLAAAGGIGFYYGRHLNPVPAGVGTVNEGQSRSRSLGPGPGPTIPPAPRVVPPVADPDLPPPPAQEYGDPSPLLKVKLGLPIEGLALNEISDTFNDARGDGSRPHEAVDIMSPRGTPVLAMVDGIVRKVFTSVPGGLTVYQLDSAEKYCFYYAHLDRYAAGLREGILLKRGDTVGYVGSTGNADSAHPHLHLAIFELGPDKNWWEGNRPVNPYPILVQALAHKQIRP